MQSKPLEQLAFLAYETKLIVSGRSWRWLSVWFTQSFWAIFSYRLDRFFYLLMGRYWQIMRIFLLPLIFVTRPWRGNCEINYKASIDKGLQILHPSMGVVINGRATIGKNFLLTGGNCIGSRLAFKQGTITIGDNVTLGINATILGPITLGNHLLIGACALVLHDAGDHLILTGVPAEAKPRNKPDNVDDV